jgi:endonuclease G
MKDRRLLFGIVLLTGLLFSCNSQSRRAVNKAISAGESVIADLKSANNTDADSAALTETTPVKAPDGIEIPKNLSGSPETIICHKGYTLSYNAITKIPNWVAWKLTPDRLVANYSRYNKFLPDPTLSEADAVTTDDYKRSGWDRGHMCPAGDNVWDWKAMMESFYMTNMCPQNNNLNRGDWKELEEACRKWATEEGAIYIVCGPILYKQKHKTIGAHVVTVPEAFFKVVLCLGKHPKAIGFLYKNTNGNNPLDSYVNTVDEVERITAMDFFPKLPDEIEKKVEAKCNLDDWQFPEK